MNKYLHFLYFNKRKTIKVGDSFTKLINQLYSLSLYNVKLAVIFLLFLKNSTSVNAQYNYIAEVSEIQKDAGICDADWGGTDDPIFEFDCYEYSGVTSLINYDPNVWIGKTFESTSNPRSNDMNCNGYVVGNGQNRSGDILKFFLKGSDEDYCCGWYCDHNSNSCVSSWTSTDYTYRNDPKNQWNQFQLNWSGSYRGKIKVRWGNYYASPQTAYGNGEWVGAFYDNTNFTSYMGYMTENETFDTDFPNINDNDGAQDYRLFGDLTNSKTVYTESFSARYRMTKNFTSCGFYSFTVGADDGFRLKIDGNTVIDNWTDGGYRTNTIVAYISSGNHNLEIEYYEGSGGNRLSFSYSQVATSPSATVATTNPSTCGGNGNITVTPTSTNAASLWYASNCSSSTPQFGSQNTYGNNISYTGGYLQLTQNANSKDGTLVMNNATGYNASSILLDFDLYIGDGGGADGFSITYAGDIPGTPAGNELGLSSSNGLEIRFRTYTGGTCPQAVSVWYNETQVGSCGLASSNWRTASWQHVQLYINNSNQLTLKIGSNTAYTNLALPAGYGSQNKSTWKVALSARTGGANDNHRVDNITLLAFNQYEYSADGSGWQSSNSFTKTAGTYPMYIRAIGNYCSVSLGNATLTDPAKPTITLGTNPTICYSTSNQNANLPFTATTNSPNQYWIDFASGITDVGSSVSPSSLPVSPIGIPVAGSTASSTYNATIFVKNSTTSCVSTGNALTVTVRPLLSPSASYTIASCADPDNPYAQLTATSPGAGISGIWTKPNIAHTGTISNASNSSTIITGLSTSGATTQVQWSLYYNSAPACTTALSTALSITPTSLANITQVSMQNDGAATSTGTPVQTRYACRTCSVKNGNTYLFMTLLVKLWRKL